MLVVAANRNAVPCADQSPHKVQGLYFRAPHEEDGRKDQGGSSFRMNFIDCSDQGEEDTVLSGLPVTRHQQGGTDVGVRWKFRHRSQIGIHRN